MHVTQVDPVGGMNCFSVFCILSEGESKTAESNVEVSVGDLRKEKNMQNSCS